MAFVGPPSSAIESMGDKIASKKIAAAAGVNTIPGYKVQRNGFYGADFVELSGAAVVTVRYKCSLNFRSYLLAPCFSLPKQILFFSGVMLYRRAVTVPLTSTVAAQLSFQHHS